MFKINAESFNVGVLELQRQIDKVYKYQVTTQDGVCCSEIKARYPVYTLVLGAVDQTDYDRLYDVLQRGGGVFTCTLPYNQKDIVIEATIDVEQDGILFVEAGGLRRWDGMSITIKGINPLEV